MAFQGVCAGTVCMNTEWMKDAECNGLDPEMFFPAHRDGIVRAIQICSDCVVRKECLDYSLEIKEFRGVWGGMSGNQRRMLAKRTGET